MGKHNIVLMIKSNWSRLEIRESLIIENEMCITSCALKTSDEVLGRACEVLGSSPNLDKSLPIN